jgi:hypothetical protein
MLDRQICLILPFFTKIHGEVHHEARYQRNGNLLGVGVLPKPDEESERFLGRFLPAKPSTCTPSARAKIVLLCRCCFRYRTEIKESPHEVKIK